MAFEPTVRKVVAPSEESVKCKTAKDVRQTANPTDIMPTETADSEAQTFKARII